MIDYLSGALLWFRRRAELLLDHLCALEIAPSIEPRVRSQIVKLESTINELSLLLEDPTLTDPSYTDQHLIGLRSWVRTVDDIEAVFLPLVESWGNDEEKMQRLTNRACQEANLTSAIQPITALYSPQYFFVREDLDVIYMPRLEGYFLLHLPDLYHEIGHVLLEQAHHILWEDFPRRIQEHFDREHLRGTLQNDPLASTGAYLYLADSWVNRWLIEFTCDIFATQLCGPAYGWSHMHLCASKGESESIYHPSAGEDALHPADEARWRVIAHTLGDMGFGAEAQEIERRWRSLVHSLGESEPTNFHIAYATDLLRDMQQQIRQGLVSLGVTFYSTSSTPQVSGSGPRLSDLLNYAWTKFWQAPSDYANWEASVLPI